MKPIYFSKPFVGGPEMKAEPPIRTDSNIGRCVDGDYNFDNPLPTSNVLIGNKAGNVCTTAQAIWDTGCARTCISSRLAKELGFTGGKFVTGTIRVAVDLMYEDVELAVYDLPRGIDVLIGMDIISTGELCFIPDPEQKRGYFRFVTK